MSDIQQVCEQCQKERKQFAQEGQKHSPACATLWRLAFARNEVAWSCIQTIFETWIQKQCIAALRHAPNSSALSHYEPDDLIQDVWHNLWRYVVRNPQEALDIVNERESDLSRVMAFITTTVKHRLLEICRKPRGYLESFPEENRQEDGSRLSSEEPSLEPPAMEPVLDILALLQRHIRTVPEFLVAELIFLQGMKPQDVFDLYPSDFATVKEVDQVRQNLVRRIRNDPGRRNFSFSASLEFRVENDEVRMNLFDQCPYDEGILLDYLNGHLSAELRAAIESSPSCLESAAALKTEMSEWQPYLRQMFCPTSARLVAYQQRQIKGTEYLVLHRHVQHCPHCQAEIAMLAAVDAAADEHQQPSLVRRIHQLIFQPATMSPVPVLGEGSYRTIEHSPQIELFIRSTPVSGKQNNWTLFGRVRYGQEQTQLHVHSISLQEIEDEFTPDLETTLDEHDTFVLKGLEVGTYRLRIIMDDEELVLSQLKIGEN